MKNLSENLHLIKQIEDIEKEIRETPYHKGTEHHIGKLRARLAKLKDKRIESQIKKSGGGGGGYSVKKHGDATVVLVGPPSSGKSTLVNSLTNTQSKVADYAFTTLGVIPGMFEYKDAKIQILDIPGIIAGAGEGKGKGKQVLSVARAADLLIIITDVNRISVINSICEELEEAGVRINEQKPDVKVDKKIDGGIIIQSNLKLSLSFQTIKEIAREFSLVNAIITIKENLSLDKLIDAFSGNRVYLPAIFVINKIDLAKNLNNKIDRANFIYTSLSLGTGLAQLKEEIWQKLGFIRIYLLESQNKTSTLIMQKGSPLSDCLTKMGTKFKENVKSAKIWGPGAKFPGQEVSLNLKIEDGMQVRFI